MKLTIHLRLALVLRMCGASPQFPVCFLDVRYRENVMKDLVWRMCKVGVKQATNSCEILNICRFTPIKS